jgi:hypothetical protein
MELIFEKNKQLVRMPLNACYTDISESNEFTVPLGVISWDSFTDKVIVKVRKQNLNQFLSASIKNYSPFFNAYKESIKAMNKEKYGVSELLHYKDREGFTFNIVLNTTSNGFILNSRETLIKRATFNGVKLVPLFNNVYDDSHICWGRSTAPLTFNNALLLATEYVEFFFTAIMNDDNCYQKGFRFINSVDTILAKLEERSYEINSYYNLSREQWDSFLTSVEQLLKANSRINAVDLLLLTSMFDIDISLFDMKFSN